jgi:hypothetical protein
MEAVMKKLLFMTVVIVEIYGASNGMNQQQRYDFTGVSDLRAIMFEINVPNANLSPDRVFQLKKALLKNSKLLRLCTKIYWQHDVNLFKQC